MNTSILETIIAVSKTGSFQEAAYNLNYSPAVVSKHIAKAEEELGVKLFFRGNKASAAVMTPECEAIIEELSKMKSLWNQIGNTLDSIKNNTRYSRIRIGLTQRTWNYREDEIIADFIRKNPDILTDVTHAYFPDLLDALAEGKLDGVFLAIQGPLENLEVATAFRKKYECSFFHVMDLCQMYLAISDRHPLAVREEADFSDFRDFSLAMNSNRQSFSRDDNLRPFEELSRKYGMDLKYTYLPTTDSSAYQIAKNSNIAIPIPDNGMKFEGIKYIRLRDWTAPLSFYFITMNSNKSPTLKKFRKCVSAYHEGMAAEKEPENEKEGKL